MIAAAYKRMGREGRWKFIGCINYDGAGPLPFKVTIPLLKNWQHTKTRVWYKLHQDEKLAQVNSAALEAWRNYRCGRSKPAEFKHDATRPPDVVRKYKQIRDRRKHKPSTERPEHFQNSLFEISPRR